MAKNKKKVILFIVEGISDKTALEPILDSISMDEVRFAVVNGDITSDINKSPSTILNEITKIIKNYTTKSKISKENIFKVIHLTDTDGCYMDDSLVIEDKDTKGFIYSENNITASSKNEVISRNNHKTSILNRLSSTNAVFRNLPYEIYYFSCNLDHVLYDDINLDKGEKVTKADDFEDMYCEDLEGFIKFITQSDFSVNEDYKDSWDFIKTNNNSLKRYTNFSIFINNIN